MKKDNGGIAFTLFAALCALLIVIFGPVLTFGLGYFGGWLLKVFVGDAIASGLNFLFDTTRFTKDFIPITCATIATIGRYFRSSQNNTNKSERSSY